MPTFRLLIAGLSLLFVLVAAPPGSLEQRFTELKKSPPELYAFLLRMPKGGDLHNHLVGANYAEMLMREAGAGIRGSLWRCWPGGQRSRMRAIWN